MTAVRIFKPPKSAMQSGRGRTAQWVLEPDYDAERRPEPLMGWTSSDSTLNQVRLTFDTKEEAIAFAAKKGWTYTVQPAQERKVRPRNYADNFRYRPPVSDER